MTTTHEPSQHGYVSAPAPAKRQRRWLKPTLFGGGGIILLVAGVGIGAAGQQSTITSYRHQAAQLRSELATTKGNLTTEQTRLSVARSDAANAMSTALAQVQGQYRSKLATLQQQEQKVAGMQRKLQSELGVVQASTISADGVYVVGKDIPSGMYHTSGGGQCYFATLGSTDTSNILDNNNFNGPETVAVSGAYAFQISGGCTWHKVG